MSFGPVKAENTQVRGVKRMCQPVVSRAAMEAALTQRNLVIATGMMTSNVGQPVGYEVFVYVLYLLL